VAGDEATRKVDSRAVAAAPRIGRPNISNAIITVGVVDGLDARLPISSAYGSHTPIRFSR